jgi:hypothetical protein
VSIVIFPPFLLFDKTFDLKPRILATPVHTVAPLGGGIPGIGIVDVLPPEGPCAALIGADIVNGARTDAVVHVKENAVLALCLLDDGHPPAHAFEVLPPKFLLADTKVTRYPLGLISGYPDIALARAGTTPAALGALKTQPRMIPRIFGPAQKGLTSV